MTGLTEPLSAGLKALEVIAVDGGKLIQPAVTLAYDAGRAPTRTTAVPGRLAQARLPFDPAHIPEATGVAATVLLLTIAASTFISEDLTCVAAGIMVAEGLIGFLPGAFACFLGIYVGDLLLFAAGRLLGRPALSRAPLKWFIQERDVERSSAWFSRQGAKIVVVSRFLPGTRLPTYFAIGLLNTRLWQFAFYFLLAAAVWTPLLVGLSAGFGSRIPWSALLQGQHFALKLGVTGIVLFLATRLFLSLASYKGRRMLISSWRRATRWEFWPPWIFYLPVLCYLGYLALRHRSLTVFTAANPAMPASGFIGESKWEILQGLSGSNGFIARAAPIESSGGLTGRITRAKSLMAEKGLHFPVVLKPDAGQRGAGVGLIRSEAELEAYLGNTKARTIIQEYVPGYEFGVFYYRYPSASKGRIFSITEKRFPVVTGDGKSDLEHLILKDKRAIYMARFYLKQLGEWLRNVPAKGETVQLVELGTHCRGAIFLDGSWVKTEALEEAIDLISKAYNGFYFGRFDIRTSSIEDFKQGRNFKVVELNGVTSEATHIYDPKNGLFTAYKILFAQWRIAFEIGAQNRRRSIKPAALRTLAGLLLEFKQQSG
jgi:membrane protein DedA with SNARE-associated domain